MFWYTHVCFLKVHWDNTKKQKKKAKFDIILPFYTKLKNWVGQNHWHPQFNIWLHTLRRIWLKPIASFNHQQVSYTSQLEFCTTLLLQTAPGLSDLKGALLQQQFWNLSIGVLWDLDPDSLLTTALCLQLFLGALWGMFWDIVLLEHITGHVILIVYRFHVSLHTINASSARGSKTTPKHLWTSTIFDCRYGVLFFVGLIPFSVKSRMTSFAKKLYLSLICP